MTSADTAVEGDTPPESSPELAGKPSTRALAVVAAVLVAAVAASVGLVAAPGHGRFDLANSRMAAAASMPKVAPAGVIDIATLSPAVAAEYRYAADHADDFGLMRCWCGCEKAFTHRSLAECFRRPDGGWEAHGAGCGVCLAEAMTAHRRLDAGDAPADIARDLDAEYGPPPTAAPARA